MGAKLHADIADAELECGSDTKECEGCRVSARGLLCIKDGVCPASGGLLCSKLQSPSSPLTVVSSMMMTCQIDTRVGNTRVSIPFQPNPQERGALRACPGSCQ